MPEYTVHDLADMKGTSEPVRQALFAMQEKIHRLEALGVKHWVGLTVQEATNLMPKPSDQLFKFAQAIEAKLKDKNT